MNEHKDVIKKRINTLLAERDVTQKELASYLEVSPNVISYFCGGTRIPNTEQIIKMSKFFDVSSDYLLGINDNSSTDNITNFSTKDLLYSIVTVLLNGNIEIKIFEFPNGIDLDNNLETFVVRVSDLIKVFHQGSLTADLFDICIKKIVNDFSEKVFVFDSSNSNYKQFIDIEKLIGNLDEFEEC